MSGDQISANNLAFSIVIPAFKEERRLPTSIRDLRAFFGRLAPAGDAGLEVLIVIEKSPDLTLERAREAAADAPWIRVIDNRVHRGKGFAVRSGMLQAKGDIVFFMDADLSTPLAEIIAFMGHFSSHPEVAVVIGSREHEKSRIMKSQGRFRRGLGRTFNRMIHLIGFSPTITDTQCGFKAFRQTAAREIFSRAQVNGFAFDVEVLLLAEKLGFKIDVHPVRWINSPDSRVRILIDPLKMLWDLVRIRRIVRRSLREKPPSPSMPSSR